ncbi:Aerobic glycerol-3-phosphate dehydrogenase [Pseudovibrio sp. Ad26]|nr:Aerobic glycerol-3-phosphate dehydrogenase [Pseudovibrio sp. Ad26]
MSKTMSKSYDLFVIGGGINGCGIARDAAGRGLSVFLAEKTDFASATSSASTKLIHGGLRYLEYYEFRLVREALKEREVLLNMAPHIIWPLRFILPHHKGLRPAWFLRLGLFMYDHLGGRKLLPATKTVPLDSAPFNDGLKSLFTRGFEYSDCWVNDARLVVLNARDAAARGAEIRRNTEVVRASRNGSGWDVEIRDNESGKTELVHAKALVNAAGPWVSNVLKGAIGLNSQANVRLVKGSHIIVPKMFGHDRSFIFQNADGRIVFAIPYEDDFTLIGTTDVDYQGDPSGVACSDDEVAYLCSAVSEYFSKEVTPDMVVRTYSGVRPLYDDGASEARAATRDYVLEMDEGESKAPLLSVFGGKITTYRRLAEHALEKLADYLPQAAKKNSWTKDSVLPGGDFEPSDFGAKVASLKSAYPFLEHDHAYRLVRSYGSDAMKILGYAKTTAEMGAHIGGDLYACEVNWMVEQEWAVTAEDILWRRSKLGLHLPKEAAGVLEHYLASYFEASRMAG